MKKIFALILTVAMALLAFSACKDKEEDNKSYTVTFDSDGGSEVASQTVESGEKATKPADPVKDRYTFLGWFVGGEKYDFEKPVTSDLTLTAKWSVSAYTVTVNADNGAEVKTETVEHGVFVELPENPTKTGFEFLGWFVGGEEYDFSTPVTSDITIIAKWKQITYKVIIDSNNGEEPVSETVAHGSCLELPEDPAYTGFELLGWFVGDERYDFEKPVTSGFTIVAKWQAATVDLSAIAGTWSGVENGINTYELVIDADGSVTAKYENSYTKVELQKNYVLFDGERFTFNYTSDLVSGEMVFVFSKDNYTLTTNSAVAGQQLILTRKFAVTFDYNYEKSGAPKTVYVEYGKTVTEEKATRVGYNRDGWYLGEDKYEFNTPVNGDITLTAKWKEITATYTVKFVYVNPTSGAETEKGSFSVSGGELFDISNKPVETKPSGYTFMGWYNGDVLFDFNTPITSDITLTSKYKGVDRKVTFYNQDKTICKEIYVENGKSLPENEIPVPKMNDGYVFNGVWMKSAVVSAAPQVTTAITSDTKYYPAYVSTKITALEGTWVDASGTYKFEITVDDVTMVTTAKFSIDGGNTTYNAESVQFDGAQLIIKYYQTGSTSIKQIKITYDEANGAVKYAASSSNIIDLVKQA